MAVCGKRKRSAVGGEKRKIDAIEEEKEGLQGENKKATSKGLQDESKKLRSSIDEIKREIDALEEEKAVLHDENKKVKRENALLREKNAALERGIGNMPD